MKNEKFMEQKAKDMTITELSKAIMIKTKEQKTKKEEENLTIKEEIKKYPHRFERLTGKGWEEIIFLPNLKIINETWNNKPLDHNVFYASIGGVFPSLKFKEIIRRKPKFSLKELMVR